MSTPETLIEAAKQGDLEHVKAILETDDSLAGAEDETGATPKRECEGRRPPDKLASS